MFTCPHAEAATGAPKFLMRVLQKEGGAAGVKSSRFLSESRFSPMHSLVAIDLPRGVKMWGTKTKIFSEEISEGEME